MVRFPKLYIQFTKKKDGKKKIHNIFFYHCAEIKRNEKRSEEALTVTSITPPRPTDS